MSSGNAKGGSISVKMYEYITDLHQYGSKSVAQPRSKNNETGDFFGEKINWQADETRICYLHPAAFYDMYVCTKTLT